MKKRSKKSLILLVSVLVLAFAAVGGVLAYLSSQSDTVVNEFIPSSVTVKVTENPTFKQGIDTTKTNVAIQNTGDIDAYIRAAVVVTWQKKNGDVYEVYGKAPVEGVDYEIVYAQNLNWVLGVDGFYYWRFPVKAGNSTDVLIERCTVKAAAPAEGYTLHVEILGSGIQSKPATVVVDEWSSGVNYVAETNGGVLSINPVTNP